MAFIPGFEWRFGLCVSLCAGYDPHPIHFQPSLPFPLPLEAGHVAGPCWLVPTGLGHCEPQREPQAGENEVGKLSQSPGFGAPPT